jgi:hypothetical protein
MNDLEISKALALAIGWEDCNIDPDVITIRNAYKPKPELHCWDKSQGLWREFSYTDWNVIGPIAAKYNCFPLRVFGNDGNDWRVQWVLGTYVCLYADTPQKAIALAVIQGAKK